MEEKVIAWLWGNWPSLVIGAAIALTYVRLHYFVAEQKRQKKILMVVVDLCSANHDESAKEIMEAMKEE